MKDTVTESPPAADAPRARINHTRVVRCAAHVAAVTQLTHDTYELIVRRDSGEPTLLARAGQFATMRVAGIDAPRAYSFARDPAAEAPGEHTFVIRAVPGGEMSAWLVDGDHGGEAVEIAGPLGSFLLDDADTTMLFIAGGSGMSATRALLEAAARQRVARDALFLYGARARADLYAGDDMAAITRQWPDDNDFRYVEILSDEPADSDWSGPRGFVTDYLRDQILSRNVVAPGRVSAWLCGPPPMIEAGAAVLEAAGVPSARIYRDVFEDASSPAPVIDNRRCVLCDECLLVRPVADCIVETGRIVADAAGRMASTERLRPGATAGLYYNGLVINPERCIRCSACVGACPHGAISSSFEPLVDTLQVPRDA